MGDGGWGMGDEGWRHGGMAAWGMAHLAPGMAAWGTWAWRKAEGCMRVCSIVADHQSCPCPIKRVLPKHATLSMLSAACSALRFALALLGSMPLRC